MDLGLKDRVVLITGGSVGIGLGVAKNFLAEAAKVVICARDSKRLKEVVLNLQKEYNTNDVWGVPCDVTKQESIVRLFEFIKDKVGSIDILINNAGSGSEETNMEAPDEKWYYYWDLHVMAAVRMCRLCVPLMGKTHSEGVIINTVSLCATQPLYYEPIYNVTKAALNMYTKCLAEELIKHNIRVMAVSPGLVLTPDWYKTAGILSKKEGITEEQYFEKIAKSMTPIARYASVDEIAAFYVFLASSKASYCLGTNFHVDGGAMRGIS
ncbi:SDR family oxidoreductase [Treponema sp. OMZ 840]|uniref:SDR family NAD(P)-dependent oxidoreductase n=1 Tax=Treponema sp. OMZ 840 TaxID=244313 RepID=UPI003D8C6B06